jgi:hypothetical protein
MNRAYSSPSGWLAEGKPMDWNTCLEEGETLRWEGRPAPRAFVFRNWVHSLFGGLLLAVAVYWQVLAARLAEAQQWPWLALAPIPFLLVGLYLAVGHLLLARLEWEKVFYAVSDRRLLARKGLFRPRLETFALADLARFRVKPIGPELATLRVFPRDSGSGLVFTAVEQPRPVIALLESALADNGQELAVTPL